MEVSFSHFLIPFIIHNIRISKITFSLDVSMLFKEEAGHGMDFLDQYGIQLFGDSSDDDETYLVSNPRKIKATSMRK